LVKHLDDTRYCITAEYLDRGTHNWEVGDVCDEIVGRWLAAAYYRNVTESELVYARLRKPDMLRDRKKGKLWCEERSEKPLWQLQVETCEWMLPEIAELKPVPALIRRAWVAGIVAEMKSLRDSKRAVPFDGFGPEEFVPYNKIRAEQELERLKGTKEGN
jgi:hypothetical protein